MEGSPLLTINSNRSLYTYYLKGNGIEIGALNSPLVILHDNAKVKYVDYKSVDELKNCYPELDNFVKVDILSTAQNLEGLKNDSLDFIIANHVIEHLVNPMKSLQNWHTKLKHGGILYLAFPHALACPDKTRKITSVAHLVQDYATNIEEANDEHLLGFVHAWNPGYFKDPDEIGRVLTYMWERGLNYLDARAQEMLIHNADSVKELLSNRKMEAHQHSFNYQTMLDLFQHIYERSSFKYQLIDLSMTKYLLNEFIFILKKIHPGEGPFMDAYSRLSAEKEKLWEVVMKGNSELISEQMKILDQRYEINQSNRNYLRKETRSSKISELPTSQGS